MSIAVLSSLDPAMAYRMFISYAQSDGIVGQFIQEKLQALGVKVFLDRDELKFGERFRDRILPEVEQANELVALLTPSSLQRAWMFAEIGVALRADVRIVGVLYGGTTVEDLQERGILSLIGDIHHVFNSDEIGKYLEQVKQRVEAAAP